MIKILMCGPIASSGGVATHTKNIVNNLNKNNIHVEMYDTSQSKIDNIFLSNIIKIFRRSILLCACILIKGPKMDIIHIQTSGGLGSFIAGIFGVIGGKIIQKPVIITFHYSRTEFFLENYTRLFYFVLKNSQKMILVSYKQIDAITKKFPDTGKKLSYIPNGFNEDIFFLREQAICRTLLELPQNRKIVFNISNLIPSKGHKYLISAMQSLNEKRDDLLCYIAGRGTQYDELSDQIRKSNLTNKVNLLGWIPDEQIPLWINACDLFVLPSSAEGNPIVMFETLSCGKPFIGTFVGGMPEIICSDDFGFLVEPQNPIQLSNSILMALDKEWEREKIINYSKQFTWQNIAQTTKNLYMSLSEKNTNSYE